mmetsp:Transcript_15048/g.44924  ORF Transcript_15048/g.44924 Transcript_15048/m.44924 type:complete len:783 (+) Transcript_15048:160-2508(+)
MLSHRTSKPLAAAVRAGARPVRSFIAGPAYNAAKKLMPKISETERVALGCGTVGFDREIFSGAPSFEKLMAQYPSAGELTEEEQAFLAEETDELCAMVDDFQVLQNKDFDAETWAFMRKKGFFGLKIPKEWGGKGFSTAATSAILVKLASASSDLSSTVAVPNSLGPGELLVRYGTPAQKEGYLPGLADGTFIPCFGLTGVHSGSDATSLIGSFGDVEERDGELGVVCTFDKRYITLAPVAGLVGIGFELRDPKGLLKGTGAEGFTVALLERDHERLEMGPRHCPLSAAFMNGTVKGQDVWVPMDAILGGQERCGFGWHMFVECLAEGRGVSLPAMAVALGKGAGPVAGAYARARKQFKVPIAEFGGVQEALAQIGSDGYIALASTELMNAVVDNHEAPMVLSSIMKQNVTDRGRNMVNATMDVLGGAGISMGDTNYVGGAYMSFPIAITVEGANIMTRSFQIIGQGLMRCHPHLLDVVEALQAEDKDAPSRFMKGVGAMAGHGVKNLGRSLALGMSDAVPFAGDAGEAGARSPEAFVAQHERRLRRLSANFAFAADLALLLGGRLKFEEMFMGRLADAVGAVFLGYATLHHYARNAGKVDAGLQAVAEHALLRLEAEARDALLRAADNVPPLPLGAHKAAGVALRTAVAPLGSLGASLAPPSDALAKRVSDLLTTTDSDYAAKLLTPGVFTSGKVQKLILDALPLCLEADAIQAACRKARKEPTADQRKILEAAAAARDEIVQVQAFEKLGAKEFEPGYVRPALAQTSEWLAADEPKRAAA